MAVHSLACRRCGNQFESMRKRAYCGPQCHASAPKRSALRCADCAAEFRQEAKGRPPKRCKPCAAARSAGVDERRRAREARRLAPKPSPRVVVAVCRTEHVCQGCGSTFLPKRTDRTKFCGRQCAFAHSAMWQEYGGSSRLSKRRRDLALVADAMRVRVSVQMNVPRQGPPLPRTCRCGEPVMHKWARNGMCRRCLDAAKMARPKTAKALASKRKYRLARKARQRGARVEPVDPIKVLARDGWRCQLCGVRTPKRLRGSFEARAPELDHIVPIAAGGEHSYRNTQCACRQCNLTKAAKPMGQLRLF